jgi:hypothetical protein
MIKKARAVVWNNIWSFQDNRKIIRASRRSTTQFARRAEECSRCSAKTARAINAPQDMCGVIKAERGSIVLNGETLAL